MKPVLADSSALLAYLQFEPGADVVGRHLHELCVAAANLAEVVAVLTARGINREWIESRVLQVFSNVVSFDREQATLAGYLVSSTQEYGLSLGDRACLAAGIILNAKVLTADAIWKKLDLGIDITLIRRAA